MAKETIESKVKYKKGENIKVFDNTGLVIDAIYHKPERFNHHKVFVDRMIKGRLKRLAWYLAGSRIV